MNDATVLGWVTRLQSGFYNVQLEDRTVIICQPRGRLKLQQRNGDVIAVGDRVQVSLLPAGKGMIEAVEPRKRALVRQDPRPRGMYQQILLANLDQLVMVFACINPFPSLRMLDRFLVIAEKQGIPASIVANKIDLIGVREARKLFGHYPALGYPVIYTSAHAEIGLAELRKHLAGKISGLAGPSGVGKSSLLNRIQPDLGLAVREVSQLTTKGRHTTVVRELFPLQDGGYVADLPGLRSLALWDTQAEELDGYFPELSERVSECQFNDCTHNGEPGCAVMLAVEEGRIHPARYESYLRLRFSSEVDG
jgi:ribosome biogenesis GTPase